MTFCRRGLGQDLNRPLPDKLDDDSHGFQRTDLGFTHRDSAFGGDDFDDVSEPSTANTQGRRSWMAMSNGWTTGQSTERSSIYSFGEDVSNSELKGGETYKRLYCTLN